ncbi:AAA family ATPase [uncultured Rhodoblastus sp.]|uniref:AAA family ATPase n=1 Tax=uncultured Rhodoblastus sp. TaxID=543037 RepID=UPI0025D0099C|nr:AAA family ATPase [uncultured Rhodoblastus sp.]
MERRNAWWRDQNRGGASPAFKLPKPACRADGRPVVATDRKTFTPAYTSGLVTLSAAALLKREFPPREMMIAPFFPEKGIAMAFAERGIGKTHFAMGAAYAVASGGEFMRFKAPRARRVVYIDGEMPGLTLKERLASIVANADREAPDDYLNFVAADLQPDGLPDLANPDAHKFYDAAIKDADMIVVDNLSTICRGLRENDADSWGPVQEWCLRQRAAGKSVLLVHHAGKGGAQRGTSRKEDVLDTVISLRRPVDYVASQGARFEVHFTKSRGFYGADAEPFEAQLVGGQWTTSEIRPADDDDAIMAFKSQGLSFRQIADRTGLAKSTVADRLKKG